MRILSRGRRPLLLPAVMSMLTLPAATEALAHAELKSSVPAAGAIVAAPPTKITFTFSESIEPEFSGATLTGPENKPVKTGPATLDANDHATLVVPVTDKLEAGKYTVIWHDLSSDGHKLKGSFTFTVKP